MSESLLDQDQRIMREDPWRRLAPDVSRAADRHVERLREALWSEQIVARSRSLRMDPDAWSKLLIDPVVLEVVSQASEATAGGAWTVQPASGVQADRTLARVVTHALSELAFFGAARLRLAEAVFTGAALERVSWEQRVLDVPGLGARSWDCPVAMQPVSALRLARHKSGAWLLRSVERGDYEPIADETEWVLVRWRLSEESLGFGTGLYDLLCEHVARKAYVLDSSYEAVARYATGLLTIGVEPPHDDGSDAEDAAREQQSAIRRAVRDSVRDGVIVYPRGAEIGYQQPGGTGVSLAQWLLDYHDAALRSAARASNLTSSASQGGSYALAKEQGEREDQHCAWHRMHLAESLTSTLIRSFLARNVDAIRAAGLIAARAPYLDLRLGVGVSGRVAEGEVGTEGGGGGEAQSVAETAWTGVQFTSVREIVSEVASGALPHASAEAILRAGLPTLSGDLIRAMIAPAAERAAAAGAAPAAQRPTEAVESVVLE